MTTVSDDDRRSYVFAESADVERLVHQQELYAENFEATINRLLYRFGLGHQMWSGGRILDVGCAHGRYVEQLRQMLRNRGRAAGVRIDGIDLDDDALGYARRHSGSGEPRAVFARHDAAQPLTECGDLTDDGPIEYNLVYALLVLEHFQHPWLLLPQLYDYVKPGGFIYLRDFVMHEGADGWHAPHPAVRELSAQLFAQIPSVRSGVAVADSMHERLADLGAVVVHRERERVPVGGSTRIGAGMLRNWLMTLKNGGSALVGRGIVTQRDVDVAVEALQEPDDQSLGWVTYVTAVAQRPA